MSKTSGLFLGLHNALEKQLASKLWLLKSIVLVTGISLFFQFPNYTYLKEQLAEVDTYVPKTDAGHNNFWKVLLIQSQAPLKQARFNEIPRHEDVMAYRLTLPTIAYFLGLGPKGMFVALNLFNILFFLSLLIAINAHTKDKVLALLVTIALSTVYVGCSGFIDVMGLTVMVGYALLLLAISFRNPMVIFLSVFLAAYSDERALIGSSLVFFWWLSIDTDTKIKGLKDIIRPRATTYAVVAAWLAYFASKWALGYFFGFNLPLGYVGLYAFFDMYSKLAISLWSTFEGLWIFIIAYFMLLVSRRDVWNILFAFGGLLLICLFAAMTHDLTKSLSYMIVLLPIAIVYLNKHLSRKELRGLATISAIICILAPTVYVLNTVMYTSPLYQEVVLYLKVNYTDLFYPEHIQEMYKNKGVR